MEINWRLLIKRSLIIIGCFVAYRYSKYVYALLIFGVKRWESYSVESRLTLMLITSIIFASLAKWLITRKLSLSDFGLQLKDFPKGLLFACLFVLPQLIGLGIYTNWNFQTTGTILYRGFVLAGFGEEFIFRAFLFGLLFRYAGWGFLSAGIFSGLFFGWGHLYQAGDLSSAISIFLFTTGASVGFSWFYYAWKSLWMVLFLHALMDITWDSFQVESNVTGNLWINVARFTTLIVAIAVSVRIAKSENRYDLKRKNKLWINREALQHVAQGAR